MARGKGRLKLSRHGKDKPRPRIALPQVQRVAVACVAVSRRIVAVVARFDATVSVAHAALHAGERDRALHGLPRRPV